LLYLYLIENSLNKNQIFNQTIVKQTIKHNIRRVS